MKLTAEQKGQIIEVAHEYLALHTMTEQQLSKSSGVSNSYLNTMMRGETKYNDTEIGDQYFLKLAALVGVEIEKQYIELELTTEFMTLIAKLERAKKYQVNGIFVAPTGRGKTVAVTNFKKKNPGHTYVITVDSLCTVRDIIHELAGMLGVHVAGSQRMKQHTIIQKLRDLKLKGAKPVLIFDEGENMKLQTFQMLKGLYDGISKHCGIMLVGTKQMMDMLEKLKKRDKQGVPQFYRRFKANTCVMVGSRMGLEHFVKKYVKDLGLRALLYELCENYGEFHDYMVPVMREADKRGVPVTEELFRLVHDMPKYK